MPAETTNLLADLPTAAADEDVATILARPGCRIERIVSHGHVTPPERPYCQPHDEWVLVLAGAARLDVEGVEHALGPGDHLLVRAGARHRVTFTDPSRPTIWLAVHLA